MDKKNIKKEVISASEIGQFYFCSNAWYLQKCGFKPESIHLEKGITKHQELGNILEKTNYDTSKSKTYSLVGYILLTIVILLIIFEVFL